MLGLTLKDVVVDILIVGVALAFVVGIAANFASESIRRRAEKTSKTETKETPKPVAPRPGWMVRKWLYFLGSLAAALFALFLWIAFWYPLVQASSIAGLNSAHQALIPPVSAFMFLVLAMYLSYEGLLFIIYFEVEFGGQVIEVRRALRKSVLLFIGVTAAIVLLISSVVGFLMVLANLILTPGRLMSWIYGVILASTIVWLALTLLTTSPFELQAFGTVEPEKKGE